MDLNQFGLKPLSFSDKPFVDSILTPVETTLSAYSFTAHYIWRDIFQFYQGIIDGHFCLFARYGDYIYMPLPPVLVTKGHENERDKNVPPIVHTYGDTYMDRRGFLTPPEGFSDEIKISFQSILSAVFSIMNKINKNPAVSRIGNIDESQKETFVSMGYNVSQGESEYVYLRDDLVTLKGNSYKSKRALYNYFVKNYQYSYEPFQPSYAEESLKLYDEWRTKRGIKFNDSLYQALLEDSSYSHKQAVNNCEALSLTGRVVRINKRVEGYIFGFNRGDISCILMEITNPDIKGLSQFIFREFCIEAEGFRFINTLGDSGLANLRNAKRSYRPYKTVPAFAAYDKK